MKADQTQFEGVRENRGPLARKKVLLADYVQSTRDLVRQCLAQAEENYEVVDCPAEELPWKVAESMQPDIVVIGWESSENGGWDLLKKLRVTSSTREIPVIVLNGDNMKPEDVEIIFSAGARTDEQFNVAGEGLPVRMREALNLADLFNENRPGKRWKSGNGKINNGRSAEQSPQLDLMIHSAGVRNKLVERLDDIRPYLSAEGKSKLGMIVRQLKWELKTEERFNLEKEFDEINADLYRRLDAENSALTRYEKRLCAYLVRGHSATDIARINTKSLNCINVAFARIRSKLSFQNNRDLHAYLLRLKSPVLHDTREKREVQAEAGVHRSMVEVVS